MPLHVCQSCHAHAGHDSLHLPHAGLVIPMLALMACAWPVQVLLEAVRTFVKEIQAGGPVAGGNDVQSTSGQPEGAAGPRPQVCKSGCASSGYGGSLCCRLLCTALMPILHSF